MAVLHFLLLWLQLCRRSPLSTTALITVLCTLPVTSCSAERSFSDLKRIKSILRSSMTNERLSGLTLLYMHQDIPIDIEEVIEEFSRRHPRRLQL